MQVKNPLEAVWEHREEVVYPNLFGPKRRGIFLIAPEMFLKTFGQKNIDPCWLHYGILEHGPSERGTYYYVTSGASNPWELEPEDYGKTEYSGVGTELVLEAAVPSDWAIGNLQWLLAFNILLVHGRFGNPNPFDYWHRVSLGGAIVNGSLLDHVLFAPAESYPTQFRLASGRVDLLHAVGITEWERDFAKENGSEALLPLLKKSDAFPVTNPARAQVLT